jgi:hydroxyacylglutathione hydrolase
VKELVEDLFYLRGLPPNANSYLIGDVLVNAGTRWGAGRLLRRLRGREVRTLLLTHAHPPTQGGAARLCDELGLELWCGRRDVAATETGEVTAAQPDRWFNRFQQHWFAGPGRQVVRALEEGDEIGSGFEVLETPGHAPGHIALWRGRDRTLVLGDVVTNENVWVGLPGLREPPPIFTADPAENRRSAQRLAALEPQLICFDHGRPLRDVARFHDFVERTRQAAGGSPTQ